MRTSRLRTVATTGTSRAARAAGRTAGSWACTPRCRRSWRRSSRTRTLCSPPPSPRPRSSSTKTIMSWYVPVPINGDCWWSALIAQPCSASAPLGCRRSLWHRSTRTSAFSKRFNAATCGCRKRVRHSMHSVCTPRRSARYWNLLTLSANKLRVEPPALTISVSLTPA